MNRYLNLKKLLLLSPAIAYGVYVFIQATVYGLNGDTAMSFIVFGISIRIWPPIFIISLINVLLYSKLSKGKRLCIAFIITNVIGFVLFGLGAIYLFVGFFNPISGSNWMSIFLPPFFLAFVLFVFAIVLIGVNVVRDSKKAIAEGV